MLGRRLDRYVTFYFVWHFLLTVVAILGLYIVVDTFSKLDEFIELESFGTQIRWIATYHLYQIPVLLTQFLPIVTLIAGVIALSRLSRYNELNAMKAVGISMQRTVLPILLCSVAIGALAVADQELLLPSIENDIRSLRTRIFRSDSVEKELFSYDTNERTTVYVRKLDKEVFGYALSRLEASPRPPVNPQEPPPPPFSLQADRAIWVRHWLFLFNATIVGPDGKRTTLAHKTLLSDGETDRFNPAEEPSTRLADGSEAYWIGARLDLLDGKAASLDLVLKFASCEYIPRFQLILGGQLTRPFDDPGELAAPPIDVETAVWYDSHWLGRAQTFAQVSDFKRDPVVMDGDPLPLSISPQQLAQGKDDPTLKSFSALQRLARQLPRARQKLEVMLHGRLAFPLANLVLLLVAIPLLFQQEGGKSTWLGVGLALFISLGFYFVNYTSQLLGQYPDGIFGGIPAVAAWLPILIFGAAGAYLLYNMDT